MKGKKATIDEGGLRSPFLIRWPGKTPAGQNLPAVAGAIDLLPTLTDLAEVPAEVDKKTDGRSFANLLLEDPKVLWPDRHLFSVWRKRATVRTAKFRLDENGALFDIQKDRGQHKDVSANHPDLTRELRRALAAHNAEAQEEFARYAERPFTVGYADSTTLPARDGIGHGTIQRSSKAPNNSFFTHWTHQDDSITWDIQVGTEGDYRATVHYTCAMPNVGTTVRLARGNAATETTVTEAFDPPLWDKSKERVTESHYFVKDFKPLDLGVITLKEGRELLTLSSPELIGGRGIDVYSLVLERADGKKQ